MTAETKTAVPGCDFLSGYVFHVYPTTEAAKVHSPEERDAEGYTIREETRYGFHGNDCPPCDAEWLSDDAGSDGYLVVADDEDDVNPAEGWNVEQVKAEDLEDERWTDEGYTAVVVTVDPDGECVIARKV
ncbi:hypothetical protein [Alienimonas sp. DA493]|uniref:hypothetical protein n=1 Tax=Alienimonas sp. DA493 TaxID=3373605 RepID=UPI003754D3A3